MVYRKSTDLEINIPWSLFINSVKDTVDCLLKPGHWCLVNSGIKAKDKACFVSRGFLFMFH